MIPRFLTPAPTRARSLAMAAASLLLVAAPPLASPLEAQHERHDAAAADDLGTVDFQVWCEPAVQDDFDRAVALLHHMTYQEARSAFERIGDHDPQCAMAHWGIATTLFQPLWPARPDVEARRRGWEAVQKARRLGPGTDRERGLLQATEAFFQNPEADEWWPRIERWAEAMERAYHEQPKDDEIAAFYGLSVLAAGQVADDQLAHNARAAEGLAELHEREPLHPGAIHYTIHADDASGRADEHLSVVESYSEIAPSVPHALHMPTHLYVRLGEWPEVIDWNRRSAEAALEHPAGDRVSLHHAHALDYLLYAYLQRAEDGEAAKVLREDLARAPRRYQEDFTSAFHLAVMPARYALERRAWEEAARVSPREPDYLQWDRYHWPEAMSWFARGMGAVHTGDVDRARSAEARMSELRRQAEEAGERRFATYIEIDHLILSGRMAHAEGNAEEAVARLRQAAELEQTVEKHAVSPGALLPAHEALGDLLLEQDRPADALAAMRRRSRRGACASRRMAGAPPAGLGKKELISSIALLVALPLPRP